MKKGIIVFAAVIALGLTVGCGKKSKVLECTRTETQSGMEMKGTEKITFNGDSVKSYKAEFSVVLDEKYKSYKSLFVTSIESQFKSYSNIDGVKVETKDDDDTIKIVITADVPKMKEADLKKLDLAKKASYSKTKKDRVSSGYKCK